MTHTDMHLICVNDQDRATCAEWWRGHGRGQARRVVRHPAALRRSYHGDHEPVCPLAFGEMAEREAAMRDDP